MEDILISLGAQLKKIRKNKDLTLKQVAEMSDVSVGLISKIENFRTTPSLPVLLKIMQTLQVNLSELNLTSPISEKYILIRNGKGKVEDREDSKGLEYNFLFSKNISESSFRTYIVKVNKNIYRQPIATDA
ncbi:MAG: helix-turn-helix domain-containing protein, partial [Candidatus Sericytochromatia bacterium]